MGTVSRTVVSYRKERDEENARAHAAITARPHTDTQKRLLAMTFASGEEGPCEIYDSVLLFDILQFQGATKPAFRLDRLVNVVHAAMLELYLI